MKTYEVLEKALALIEDEKDWAQGDYRIGDALCAEGACIVAGGGALEWDGQRFASSVPPDECVVAFGALGALTTEAIHQFNDSRSHAEVVALFQGAIRNEKAKAGVPVDVPAPLAQPVERRTCNPDVAGSIPAGGSLLGGGER